MTQYTQHLQLADRSEKNPVFLDELIQVAETYVAFRNNNIVDIELRSKLTEALKT